MIVSNFACMDLEMRRSTFWQRLCSLFRREATPVEPVAEVSHAPHLTLVDPVPEPEESRPEFRWRRHPQLLNVTVPDDAEHRARRLAVKGLYSGHNGEIEEAFQCFAHALGEYELDLTELPAFWQMPRSAIRAAAEACDQNGLHRQAGFIESRLRTEFRPRNVVPMRPRTSDLPGTRVSGD